MKYFTYLIILTFLTSITCYAQKINFIRHKVNKGENLTQIAKKYDVTVSEIIQNNPNAAKELSTDLILNIPVKSDLKTKIAKKHNVLAKETLYSLSKLYNVSVEEITSENTEILKNGLKIGLIITIPTKGKSTEITTLKTITSNETIYHEVQPKETKYGIASKYNISIEKLEKLNPEILNIDLPVGYKLFIQGINYSKIKQDTVISAKNTNNDYIVKPQETLFSICKQFEISQEELILLNPDLKNGLAEGMIIKIPAKTLVATPKKQYKDLTKTVRNTSSKRLAILLPFNLTKLDQDSINSLKSRLKKDKFLNMTLDFYAGALMAIDSVKTMNLNLDISVLDSNETKNSSNISTLSQENNLKTFDAIIGPFYQNNVEKLAELLIENKVPVFSPLSKDYNKKFTNLIQTTPSANDLKNAIFNFMKSKNGNIIAIIDPKKISINEFITGNYPETQIVKFKENGNIDFENLKSLLQKDKLNFVIMETEKTNLILSLTSNLTNLSAIYNINLVTLSENEALDYEEIPMSRLVKLKLHYPSATRTNIAENAMIFEKKFKQKNKIAPNFFAIRGFDLTFDILLRLQQDQNITETLNETATEQIESKFYYNLNRDGSYTNKGVFILNYESDFTIKEAK